MTSHSLIIGTQEKVEKRESVEEVFQLMRTRREEEEGGGEGRKKENWRLFVQHESRRSLRRSKGLVCSALKRRLRQEAKKELQNGKGVL